MQYRWVKKTVADAWLDRYRKEMSDIEFGKWVLEFDKTTVVYLYVDGVEFLTRDYIKSKLDAEKNYGQPIN